MIRILSGRGDAPPRVSIRLPALPRRIAAATLGVAAILAGISCDDAGLTGSLADATPPTMELAIQEATADTAIAFNAHVTDDIGILEVRVQLEGPGITGAFDTTFHSTNTKLDIPYEVGVPATLPAGTTVMVTALALDGAGNESNTDTIFVATGNLPPAVAVITNPRSGDTAVVGFNVALSMSGKTSLKVQALGYIASGAMNTRDSVLFSSPLKDSTAVDTSFSLVGAAPGTLTLTPFLVDSLGNHVSGPPVNVTVVGTADANTVPLVNFGLNDRIEVTDTIHVEASDQAGVRWLGYVLAGLPSCPQTVSARDSFEITGNFSSAVHTFTMRVPVDSFPCEVSVKAFARNQNGVTDSARVGAGGPVRADTVTVVAGLTRALPNGGLIADALYHPRQDKLYLTNVARNELDVFDLADSTFEDPIHVGSNPWGIVAWPRDRDGTMGDTLLIANSGGTDISYVNVLTGKEVFRYALPNIIVNTITTTNSSTSGQPMQERTRHDFSDRPQFLAATCTGATTAGSPCGDVILVYSTSPTGGQSGPFEDRGTVRWENLITRQSHFFYEQAIGQGEARSDTLEIVRFAAQGMGADSTLVPYQQQLADNSTYSVVVDITDLAFRNTTFVRNSGNFRRAVIGEGGEVRGSRAMLYDVTPGFITTVLSDSGNVETLPVPVQDAGISRPTDVSDFIANAFATVKGASINFDGELSAIRGDSTYLMDATLRLKGILHTSGVNPGFDFHPENAGINSATLSTRLSFAASDEPFIEVYDTYCYRLVATVPVRDPIIGPIKAAIRPLTGQIVITGATARGVVIVTLPDNFSTTCN